MVNIRATILLLLVGLASAADLLLNAGGPWLRDIGWRGEASRYASAGSTAFTGGGPNSANGTWVPVYESHLWAQTGNLDFKLPVPTGEFDVALMFAETWADTGPGVRHMVVRVNGAVIPQAGPNGLLDVFSRADGLNKPVYLNLGKISSVGGFITVMLERVPGKSNPMISGIAILGENADELFPPIWDYSRKEVCPVAKKVTGRIGEDGFFMNVGGPALPNINWGADNTNYLEYDQGIKADASTPVPVSGNWTPAYLTYRWTTQKTLSYKIPVPSGTYKVGLLHAEPFLNGVGKRTFNISINGVVKATAYDVYAQVGMNKPLLKQYSGIKSLRGLITISFTKVVQNPFVNGIYISGPGASTVAIGGPEAGVYKGRSGPGPGDILPFYVDYMKSTDSTRAPFGAVSTIYGLDARLYLGGLAHRVHAVTLSKQFYVTKLCTTSVTDKEQRTIRGLAFNSNSNALKLHMSTSTEYWHGRHNISTGWTNGKVETITMAGRKGCFNNDRKDLITGLPVPNAFSGVHNLEFLPSGELIIALNGFTNGGISVPDAWNIKVPSNPLSGAIIS